ncbi:hypothetical protein PoB_001294800 [Plakobranchus ocellatus]|uniref:Uncharacterized protein n=1 Tax=Plakobranchus ocellatus TaxID=259542 RepID=A0AAV3YVM9_9GAST|nr:hypothetical protein PoB_001294800 [Plakobranchus ocellatus]
MLHRLLKTFRALQSYSVYGTSIVQPIGLTRDQCDKENTANRKNSLIVRTIVSRIVWYGISIVWCKCMGHPLCKNFTVGHGSVYTKGTARRKCNLVVQHADNSF